MVNKSRTLKNFKSGLYLQSLDFEILNECIFIFIQITIILRLPYNNFSQSHESDSNQRSTIEMK